jgi:hypothetical protein
VAGECRHHLPVRNIRKLPLNGERHDNAPHQPDLRQDASHAAPRRPDRRVPLRDLFDVPDLQDTDDEIANGTFIPPGGPYPLAHFTAPRVDYSLQRLAHYTGTEPEHFQNFVIFTNYAFYIDEFCPRRAQHMAGRPPEYDGFIEPGGFTTRNVRLGGGTTGVRGRPACRRCRPAPQAAQPRHHHRQHRRRPVQRQDDHRPHRRAAPACLDHARPLRRPAQQPGTGRLRARPRLCARGPRARRRPAGDRPHPGARRSSGGAEEAVAEVTGPTASNQAHHAHRHGRHLRQPQLGTARPARAEITRQLSQSPRRGARHGIGDRSPPTASASASPTARCSASPTSRCTAS